MGEGDHAFGLCETNGVWIGAVLVSMVAPLTIVAVLASGAIPNSMFGLKLFTKTAAVREWKRASGTAGGCFLVVILGHGEPLEAVVAGVLYGCG